MLFNGAGTLSKFNRLGVAAGFGSADITLVHQGTQLDPDSPDGLRTFRTVVGDGYSEKWIAGLNVLHNPWALRPLNEDLLPGAAHHYWNGTAFETRYPRGHLDTSTTSVINRAG